MAAVYILMLPAVKMAVVLKDSCNNIKFVPVFVILFNTSNY